MAGSEKAAMSRFTAASPHSSIIPDVLAKVRKPNLSLEGQDLPVVMCSIVVKPRACRINLVYLGMF